MQIMRILVLGLIAYGLQSTAYPQYYPEVHVKGAVADGEIAVFDGSDGKYLRAGGTNSEAILKTMTNFVAVVASSNWLVYDPSTRSLIGCVTNENTGPQGPAGSNGVDGATGPQGPAGTNGAVGPQGPQGPAGSNGVDGATGPQGPAGTNGAVGPQGPQGPAGTNGVDGATGPQGPAGTNGAVGPQGPQGPQGPAGTNGVDGATGPQGPAGTNGAVGPQGPQGPAGSNGVDGATGPQGPAGTNGADGAQGPAGPVTNQIMDVDGVLYTITNAPPAAGKYLVGLNPANSTAWFAAETAGDIAGWSGTMATQMIYWIELVLSTNFDGVTATNLLVSGTVTPEINEIYVYSEYYTSMLNRRVYTNSDDESYWVYGGTGGSWCLGYNDFANYWIGPEYSQTGPDTWTSPEGEYTPYNDSCTGTATVAYSYVGAVITTNIITWQAGYNPSNQAFQIIRNGIVLESWSTPKDPTYPAFRLPMGGAWTDFELKASTNNFTNLVYYYISSGTNTVGYGDSNAWVYFSDDYQTDVRAWRKSPPGSNIYAQLTSTNAVVDTIYVFPSHDCQVVWSNWMSPTNKNLVWSWVRFDGFDFEKNFDGTKQRWNLIRPDSWELERTTP